MAAGQGITDYIVIDDFTAGIVDDFNSGYYQGANDQSSGKDGAARITDTYSCLAAPRGGLVPAFGTDGTITQGLLRTAARYHPSHPYMRIISTHNVSPVVARAPNSQWSVSTGWNTAWPNNPTNPDFLWIMYQAYYDNTGAGTYTAAVAINPYEPFITPFPSISYDFDFIGSHQRAVHDSLVQFGYGALVPTRRSNSTPTDFADIGQSVLVGLHCFDIDGDATTEDYNWMYSHGFADLDYMTDQKTFPAFTWALPHQGRIVFQSRGNLGGWIGDGFGRAQIQSEQRLGYTEFNSGGDTDTPIYEDQVQFDQDDVEGTAVWHSLSANELLLIKHRGGGLMVRGDVANPNVVKLRNLPDVRGAPNLGTITPQGFVFGTRGGVYMYPGGDQAQKISPNLDGWFWKPASMTRLLDPQPYGKFGYHDPYILAPNNWCMDTRTGAWMRYHPTPDIIGIGNGGRVFPFIETSASDSFYALPAGVSNSTTDDFFNNVTATRFTPGKNLPAWSWRSQPLIRTKGRRIDVREVQILAQALNGSATAEVTIYGYKDGAATTQVIGQYTFTVPDASRPVQLTHPMRVTGGDIEIKIKTSGPINLYRLSIGYREGPTAHV